MIILIDLDGTLTDTAHLKFKPFKDGKLQTITSEIPLIKGAKEFILAIKAKGHIPVIVSDSHPQYVNAIAKTFFDIPTVSLSDKPNIEKIKNFIESNLTFKVLFEDRDNVMMIGDSWLDIELGRRLNIKTVLTNFYKPKNVEERDGIGQNWKPLKMGATYYANNYSDVLRIIENPLEELLALEAVFQNTNSCNMVKFYYRKFGDNFTAFRCLARQEDGECDRFARADKYYQIDNPKRDAEFIATLAKGVSNYLSRVEKCQEYKWDYLTYVTDKKTTKPPNKMSEIFRIVSSNVPKIELFEWSQEVIGSLRNHPNYQTRRDFISKYLITIDLVSLKNKSVIVIDDQFTSSATAREISHQLTAKGAKNILFIALFYLISPIEGKSCPVCGKPLKVKIKKIDGAKFYSCLPIKFGGNGCGYIENIKINER